MAEDKGQRFAPEVDDLEDGDEDVLFKAQMGVYQFFGSNWKYMLGFLGVFLLATLAYSLYAENSRQEQRSFQASIDEIGRRMPAPDPLSAFGMAPMDDPEDADRMANLKEGAKRYDAVAESGGGTAATMARLKAAEAWERAGETETQIASLQAAHDLGGKGVLGWSASAQLAGAKADVGDIDGAAAVLTGVNTSSRGIIAEQALLDLGLIYVAAGRNEEATATLQDFTTRYPESALRAQAAEALGRLKG